MCVEPQDRVDEATVVLKVTWESPAGTLEALVRMKATVAESIRGELSLDLQKLAVVEAQNLAQAFVLVDPDKETYTEAGF